MSLGDSVARVVGWLNADGTRRLTPEHVVVVMELFAGFPSGVQTDEKPNELWAMLQSNKDSSTLGRIRHVFHDLFCPFSPNEIQKVRVLYALLYGDTERALNSTEDYFRAALSNMDRFRARQQNQEERGVRV